MTAVAAATSILAPFFRPPLNVVVSVEHGSSPDKPARGCGRLIGVVHGLDGVCARADRRGALEGGGRRFGVVAGVIIEGSESSKSSAVTTSHNSPIAELVDRSSLTSEALA